MNITVLGASEITIYDTPLLCFLLHDIM